MEPPLRSAAGWLAQGSDFQRRHRIVNEPGVPIVVVLDSLAERSRQRFDTLCPPHYRLVIATERSPAHLEALIANAQYAITGQIAVPSRLLEAAPRLKLVHKWGVGVDNIDLEAAKRLGIGVARLAGGNAIPVAEYTIGLMITTLRHIAWSHAALKAGRWMGGTLPHDSFMLNGRTVGLVGCGAVGQRVAQLLSAFGCSVLYTQPRRLIDTLEQSLTLKYRTLDELLAEADVVSLHCPLNEMTRGLIDEKALALMKPSAILINVARGGVVDEQALYRTLSERKILAAATDVFESEPLPDGSPLRQLDNLVLSPHLAAVCADNFKPTVERLFANISRIERGEPLPRDDEVVSLRRSGGRAR